jgi:4-aminobutyrate aminotransferase-like enzyme
LNTDFLKYQAQTSPYPLGMEISMQKVLISTQPIIKKYLDFVAGVLRTLGHQPARVNQAIKDQLDKYSWYTENILKAQL